MTIVVFIVLYSSVIIEVKFWISELQNVRILETGYLYKVNIK